MARALGPATQILSEGWRLAVTASGQYAAPQSGDLHACWIDAPVPGTAAEALRRAGRSGENLADHDVWYQGAVTAAGPAVLRFEGLATLAEVWLDDQLILTSKSMFQTHDVPVLLSGSHRIWLCFRALNSQLDVKGPRARWRPRMIPRQGLRLFRTTLMGQMPGWTPSVDAVGPWRPISLIPKTEIALEVLNVRSGFDEGRGWLEAKVQAVGLKEPLTLVCDGNELELTALGPDQFGGRMWMDGAKPWWPHTHGDQPLYGVSLMAGQQVFQLGKTGFRNISVDRGADGSGFQLIVNQVPIFCRGAGWTSPDPVALPCSRERYEPLLQLARSGGMNMLRMSGVGAYEGRAFYELCDELGIMVWQDFMFANFDYPVSDPDFAQSCRIEAEQFLSSTQLSPCIAVFCGGSEAHQQAAMMGMKPEVWASPLFDAILPEAVQAWRPEAAYVANSPSGGALPFTVDAGVGHYYGVGAYMRPLEDARRADVRFASECLAFANLPQPQGINDLEALEFVGPRDLGAEWDFADVRDHYLGLLYSVDPTALRRDDPLRYLDLSRAVTGEVMADIFAEWRRGGSPCAGGLVWTFQDVMPGAGWGVVDAGGEPKPAWYALKRAFTPVQIGLTDEGVNGLAIHLNNDTANALSVEVELTCFRDGKTAVVSVRRDLTLGARSYQECSAFELIGRFFDITYAYRFGPPGHDITVVRLRNTSGEVLSEAFHFPLGRSQLGTGESVSASLECDDLGWKLCLACEKFIQSIHLFDPRCWPDDDWFHLAPGQVKTVRLSAREGTAKPSGQVLGLGGVVLATY